MSYFLRLLINHIIFAHIQHGVGNIPHKGGPGDTNVLSFSQKPILLRGIPVKRQLEAQQLWRVLEWKHCCLPKRHLLDEHATLQSCPALQKLYTTNIPQTYTFHRRYGFCDQVAGGRAFLSPHSRPTSRTPPFEPVATGRPFRSDLLRLQDQERLSDLN